jgi:phosphoglycerate dehydrogenase-like enzyme
MDDQKNQTCRGIILLARPPDLVPPDAEEKIRRAGDGREVRVTAKKAEIEPILDSVEIGFGDVPFSLISRMPRLRWVQLWSAGADRLQQHPEIKTLPFQLTSTSGMHGPQISEHVFALLLARTRRLGKARALQERHEWRQIGTGEPAVLSGKTMLILGYGAIGKAVARAALAFGMRVIGIRRELPAAGSAGPAAGSAGPASEAACSTGTGGPASESPRLTGAGGPASESPRLAGTGGPEEPGVILGTAPELAAYLPQADVVVNILPLTPDTVHFVGGAEFAAMKREALYINVGRGATTDEAALIEALRAGRIAGALLDVAEREPLAPDSPLWDMENVILTGHYAGLRADYDVLALDIALDNLGRYIRGEPLRNLVDKERGY